MRGVRTPADPEDFETTMSTQPAPVREFRVSAAGSTLVVEILEPIITPGRGGNTEYRVVLAQSSLIPDRTIRQDQIGALVDLGETVVLAPALNDGGRQRVTVANRSGDRGWYLCVPIGQRGVTGKASGLMRSPWGL